MIIELDGSQHDGSAYDEHRDTWLTGQGYTILRFWNSDVLLNRSAILETILAALDGTLASQRTADLKVKAAKV